MPKDLKQENSVPLTTILAATLFALASIQFGIDHVLNHASSFKELGLAAIVTVFSMILANLMPANVKHVLVYVGYKNALPGHRCHKICAKDPRVNLEKITARWPELCNPQTAEKDRNALWYSNVYASVKDTPEVLQSHRNFLLYRDSFSAIFLMLMASIAWYFSQEIFQIPRIQPWVPFALGLEAIVLMYIARTWGNRMVITAIASAAS